MIGSHEEHRNSRISSARGRPLNCITSRLSGAALIYQPTVPARQVRTACTVNIEFRILQGSSEGIVSGNIGDVVRVAGWLAGTDVEVALRNVISLEDEAAKIACALSAAKKALARCFLD
jgi:hypothetical protein